jgi:hypothetical protein
MRKLAALAAGLAAMVVAFAAPAMASTTTSVKMSFTEPIVQDVNSGCPTLGLPDGGFCGTGIVVPYGHATEMIAFGAACAGACDLRAVSVAGGTLVLDETFSNPQCPGSCQPNPAEPASGSLTDVIVGGTGIFSGATGTLNGAVTAAGLQSHVQLSGTITFAS